jgi:hypothetical protein
MPTSAQVEVGTEAVVIVPETRFDQTALIHNLGGGAIYLGGPDVTTSNGYTLDNGDKLTVPVGDHEALYAVAATGTHTVAVLTQIN